IDQLQQLTSPSKIPIIVEADGAACRDFKIPNYEEPLLPAGTDLLVPLVGSRIVGRELTAQYLHRVELLNKITAEFKIGDQITPQLIVDILCSSVGYNLLAELEQREVIPIINQVENEERYQFGVEVANRLIERGVNKVLLTKVEHDQPIVEVLQK
ncbi:MAG: selenium cofactor biosynthesis protein YqeC, partial [Bacillota bacterium]